MRTRILNGTMPLGAHHPDPIHDGEAFITHLATTTLDEWGMYITDDEWQELILDLLTEGLKLEQTFNPERNKSYAGYASWILRKRVVDLGPRKLLGRNGQRAAERTHDQLDDDHGDRWNGNSTAGHRTLQSGDTGPDLDTLIDEASSLLHWPNPPSRQTRPEQTHTARPGGPGTRRPAPLTRLERERTGRQTRAATILGLRPTG